VPYIERFLQDCLMLGAAMQVVRKRGHCHGNALRLRIHEPRTAVWDHSHHGLCEVSTTSNVQLLSPLPMTCDPGPDRIVDRLVLTMCRSDAAAAQTKANPTRKTHLHLHRVVKARL
jgi:hypothetical protein